MRVNEVWLCWWGKNRDRGRGKKQKNQPSRKSLLHQNNTVHRGKTKKKVVVETTWIMYYGTSSTYEQKLLQAPGTPPSAWYGNEAKTTPQTPRSRSVIRPFLPSDLFEKHNIITANLWWRTIRMYSDAWISCLNGSSWRIIRKIWWCAGA